MFEKPSCILTVLLRRFWKRWIRLTGKVSDGNRRQRALATSFPQHLAKEIPSQMALAHLSHTQLLFLSRSYQRLFYGGGQGFPPLEDVAVSNCKMYLVTEAWDNFPWGANYSEEPPPFSWIFQIWLWYCWLFYVPLYETMHNEYCPCPSPNKRRMPLWFIYFWNPCQQGENTAACTLQQFSGILQSHFISFSSLNPMTLTQLTFLIGKYDFWIL